MLTTKKDAILQDSVLLILMMMVVMPVMMVLVVSVSSLGVVDGAILLVAMLARGFELEGCVGNSMLCELLANGFFDVMCISVGNYVERCVVAVSIHTPHVNMVNILDTLDVQKMLANLVYVDTVGRFFEE